MEKFFIATNESKYFQDFKKYLDNGEQQRKFVNNFIKEKGIEACKYLVHGNGFINRAFDEWGKNEIKLSIIPEGKDRLNFGKMLTKPGKHSLQTFRKNSRIAKEFAERCVQEKIIINLHSPGIDNYFKSLKYGMYGYRCQRLLKDDCIYLKIESEHLKNDDIPEGFTEIKGTDFYKVIEEAERRNKENEVSNNKN